MVCVSSVPDFWCIYGMYNLSIESLSFLIYSVGWEMYLLPPKQVS